MSLQYSHCPSHKNGDRNHRSNIDPERIATIQNQPVGNRIGNRHQASKNPDRNLDDLKDPSPRNFSPDEKQDEQKDQGQQVARNHHPIRKTFMLHTFNGRLMALGE